jgi:pyridoxal 5'-phosphate synthase pdxT subunit
VSSDTDRPVIGVFGLQGDVREHLAALREQGAVAVVVRRPQELADVDGLVLPGGESTTMVKLAARFGLMEPLRAAVHAGLPAYGSCAGMILLADRILDAPPDQETVGGMDVTVRRNAFGRQVDSFESDLAFEGLAGGPVHAVFIRAPWVEEAGPGVEILGRVVGGPADGRIVAVRQANLVATSFHPELTGDRRVHALFVDIVRRHLAEQAGTDAGNERGTP